MDRWQGRVALVSGASAGIGAEIVKLLVKHGVQTYGAARRLNCLEAIEQELEGESGKFYPIKADFSKEEDILSTFNTIKEKSGGVDILINNAGIIVNSSLMDGETEIWRQCIDLNILGLTIATREAVKSMKERDFDGHIIHINSIAGHSIPAVAGAYLSIYPATKHAVTALTQSLRQEFLHTKTKIKITSLSPGLVKTDIFESNNMAEFGNMFADVKILDPIDIARAAIAALGTEVHVEFSELTVRAVEAL